MTIHNYTMGTVRIETREQIAKDLRNIYESYHDDELAVEEDADLWDYIQTDYVDDIAGIYFADTWQWLMSMSAEDIRVHGERILPSVSAWDDDGWSLLARMVRDYLECYVSDIFVSDVLPKYGEHMVIGREDL